MPLLKKKKQNKKHQHGLLHMRNTIKLNAACEDRKEKLPDRKPLVLNIILQRTFRSTHLSEFSFSVFSTEELLYFSPSYFCLYFSEILFTPYLCWIFLLFTPQKTARKKPIDQAQLSVLAYFTVSRKSPGLGLSNFSERGSQERIFIIF